MANEDTGTPSKVPTAAGAKVTGDEISKDTFRQMLNILKEMRNHTHQYYDDYTTACECQCQCQRGTV